MKAHCSACHAETEVEAQPGDLVECGGCNAKFRIPSAAAPVRDLGETDVVRLILAGEYDRFEAALSDALGAEMFETIKARAVEKFGEFIAELETDPGIDLEQIGNAIARTDGGGDAAAAPPFVPFSPSLDSIRLVLREEIDEALDGLADDLAEAVAADRFPAIRLEGYADGRVDVDIQALVAEAWVPIIEATIVDGALEGARTVGADEIAARIAVARGDVPTDETGEGDVTNAEAGEDAGAPDETDEALPTG